MGDGDDPAGRLDAILRELEVEYEHPQPASFVVALPGERRLKTACWLTIGAHALEIEAFVLRKPEENFERVYEHLLQQNARMYAVSWSVDSMGDVYLSGKVPLASIEAAEIDRILGSVLEYADGQFNSLLELGFGSSIRREWAWRVKRGESLANLQAFQEFAQRSGANHEQSAQRRPAD
ncbi:MAG TPA: YbjN domain-containing protein [Jatrophihabitantaceae bacterium]|nr:YbjN domain-containing protein [Jatrophihabitantaceae bacterium]